MGAFKIFLNAKHRKRGMKFFVEFSSSWFHLCEELNNVELKRQYELAQKIKTKSLSKNFCTKINDIVNSISTIKEMLEEVKIV